MFYSQKNDSSVITVIHSTLVYVFIFKNARFLKKSSFFIFSFLTVYDGNCTKKSFYLNGTRHKHMS